MSRRRYRDLYLRALRRLGLFTPRWKPYASMASAARQGQRNRLPVDYGFSDSSLARYAAGPHYTRESLGDWLERLAFWRALDE